jgi:hypothetical protein
VSLARTALRLSAVMAIANGFQSPWPTMAQARVFDSRFDPREIVDLADVIPIVTVCTDDDKGSTLSQNNGGPPFEHEVTLALELSLGMMGENDEDGGKYLGLPQSEPELEAMLDLFEHQVARSLVDPTNTWAMLFQGQCRRMSDWSSTRYVERDGNVRLAARSISATVSLQHEELIIETSGIPAPLGPLLTAIIASGSPYAGAAGTLQTMLTAAGASQPITLPDLLRVRFIEAEQAEEDGDGTPKGPRPDGVAQANLPT